MHRYAITGSDKMEDLIQTADTTMFATYKRFPIVLSKGEGSTLWDTEGRRYTDFMAGIAVCGLGHAHPRLVAAVTRQAATLWHVCNLYYTVARVQPLLYGSTDGACRMADIPQFRRQGFFLQQRGGSQ